MQTVLAIKIQSFSSPRKFLNNNHKKHTIRASQPITTSWTSRRNLKSRGKGKKNTKIRKKKKEKIVNQIDWEEEQENYGEMENGINKEARHLLRLVVGAMMALRRLRRLPSEAAPLLLSLFYGLSLFKYMVWFWMVAQIFIYFINK